MTEHDIDKNALRREIATLRERITEIELILDDTFAALPEDYKKMPLSLARTVQALVEENRAFSKLIETEQGFAMKFSEEIASLQSSLQSSESARQAATTTAVEFAKLVWDQNNLQRKDGWSSGTHSHSYAVLDEMVRLGYLEKHPTRTWYRWKEADGLLPQESEVKGR